MQVYVTKIIDPSSDPVFRVEISETCEVAKIRAEAREGRKLNWTIDGRLCTMATVDETGAEYEISPMEVVEDA